VDITPHPGASAPHRRRAASLGEPRRRRAREDQRRDGTCERGPDDRADVAQQCLHAEGRRELLAAGSCSASTTCGQTTRALAISGGALSPPALAALAVLARRRTLASA